MENTTENYGNQVTQNLIKPKSKLTKIRTKTFNFYIPTMQCIYTLTLSSNKLQKETASV